MSKKEGPLSKDKQTIVFIENSRDYAKLIGEAISAAGLPAQADFLSWRAYKAYFEILKNKPIDAKDLPRFVVAGIGPQEKEYLELLRDFKSELGTVAIFGLLHTGAASFSPTTLKDCFDHWVEKRITFESWEQTLSLFWSISGKKRSKS